MVKVAAALYASWQSFLLKDPDLIYTELLFPLSWYNELISGQIISKWYCFKFPLSVHGKSEHTIFQMAAAHLKVFPGFLLFIMLTSGNVERTWLRNRNYINFVSEWFLCLWWTELEWLHKYYYSYIVMSHTSLHFPAFSRLYPTPEILCVCGDIRKIHKEPLEACGGSFVPHACATSAQLWCLCSAGLCFLVGWLRVSESVKVLVGRGGSQRPWESRALCLW